MKRGKSLHSKAESLLGASVSSLDPWFTGVGNHLWRASRPALIELAAAAIAQVILNGQGKFKPKEVISQTGARCRRMLKDALEEDDRARRAHLRLVK